jgi:multidrug efflux pump subunit AcrB
MVVVRFLVGQNEDEALVRVNQKLAANADLLPAGAGPAVVKLRSIDDVPVMALTLWGARYDDVALRQMAAQLLEAIKEVPDIAEVTMLGGRPRQVTVTLDPEALVARELDPARIQRAISAANVRLSKSDVIASGLAERVEAGSWPATRSAVADLVVGQTSGAPVHLSDVATITDGAAEPTAYVQFHTAGGPSVPAVTLSIAKRKGVNATRAPSNGSSTPSEAICCRRTSTCQSLVTTARPPNRSPTSCCGTCCLRSRRCRRSSG